MQSLWRERGVSCRVVSCDVGGRRRSVKRGVKGGVKGGVKKKKKRERGKSSCVPVCASNFFSSLLLSLLSSPPPSHAFLCLFCLPPKHLCRSDSLFFICHPSYRCCTMCPSLQQQHKFYSSSQATGWLQETRWPVRELSMASWIPRITHAACSAVTANGARPWIASCTFS